MKKHIRFLWILSVLAMLLTVSVMAVEELRFRPDDFCTKGEFIDMVWRCSGSPAPKKAVSPYADITEDDYYHDAVLWATENGITKPVSNGEFGEYRYVTRGMMAHGLYAASGSPDVSSENIFSDVSEEDADAIMWTVGKGITSGTSATTFEPDMSCSRAQIVTFLYRAEGGSVDNQDNPFVFVDVPESEYYYVPVLWAVEHDLIYTPTVKLTASGTYGENITWTLTPEGVLTIRGFGAMVDSNFYRPNLPWNPYVNPEAYQVKSVVVEEGVTHIAGAAFYCCDALTDVKLPNSLVSIGKHAFFCVESLANIVIPEGVTDIDNSAFSNCKGLEEITIPATLQCVKDAAFYNCESLKTVYYGGTKEQWDCIQISESENDPLLNAEIICKEEPKSEISGNCGENATWTLTRDGALTISGTGAMCNYQVFENGVFRGRSPWAIEIEDNKFCEKIVSVTISPGITYIGAHAFEDTADTEITVPEGVVGIGLEAFAQCRQLETLTLPSTLREIGPWAFTWCLKLTTLEIPAGITEIPNSMMYNCTGLKSITLPNSVCKINAEAFAFCSALDNVVIPDSVTEIMYGAFSICTDLKTVTIPATVQKIEARAFGLTALETVYYGGTKAQWDGIQISESQNEPLLNAEIVYAEHMHSLTAVAEVPATTTAAGMKAHWLCSGCGTLFSDKHGEKPVSANALVIPMVIVVTEGRADVPDAVVDKVIEEASQSDTIKVDVSTATRETDGVQISAESLHKIAETDKSLNVETGYASVTMDSTAVETIAAAADGENVALEVQQISKSELNKEQKNALKSKLVATVISAEVVCGDRTISDFGGGKVTVKLPFTPHNGKIASDYKVLYINDEGGTELLEATYAEGYLVVEMSHFSAYAIVHDDPFVDVPKGEYFYEPVLWAKMNDITTGVSETMFDCNAECTRGQVVTFLWRAKGCPEPKSAENPFEDVKDGEYYSKAVLWAVENGITTGKTATEFRPEDSCTRGQVVTFLCRAEGGSAADRSNPFDDVSNSEYYYAPVLWAVENKVTTGLDTNRFGPDEVCSRAQIVTFLYRALVNT